MKTHLTTEYQSLPEHEKCNWKEQFYDDMTEKWEDILNSFWCIKLYCPTRYIPITPESVLKDRIESISELYLLNLNNDFEDTDSAFLSGVIFGHNHAIKIIIDIVEAEKPEEEISGYMQDRGSALRIILTKLKEIK